MPDMNAYEPGTFCWVELGTTDTAAAKRFYGDLLGWSPSDVPAGPTVYTLFKMRGRDVAGLYQLDPAQTGQGVPPHWLSYVAVASADTAAKKASDLGAKVMMPPFDVMDIGRMAVLQDPTGAGFAVWQPKEHPGAGTIDEPGAPCWNELMTRDLPRAREFYTQLFGWKTEEHAFGGTPYTILQGPGRMVGGMMQCPDPHMPPSWGVYFAVSDCDAAAGKAGKAGANVFCPPTDIPGVGRFAAMSDPQGASFSVIKLEEKK